MPYVVRGWVRGPRAIQIKDEYMVTRGYHYATLNTARRGLRREVAGSRQRDITAGYVPDVPMVTAALDARAAAADVGEHILLPVDEEGRYYDHWIEEV